MEWARALAGARGPAHPERIAAIVAAGTGLPAGDIPMPEGRRRSRRAAAAAPVRDARRFVQARCRTKPPDEVRAAYDAPFPDESSDRSARDRASRDRRSGAFAAGRRRSGPRRGNREVCRPHPTGMPDSDTGSSRDGRRVEPGRAPRRNTLWAPAPKRRSVAV
ncbi:hypothetical protein GCM10023259_047270 [Thermocatellispora tengchongensis]